jgi:hypothetical protein
MFVKSLVISLMLVFTASTSFAFSNEVEWLRNQSFRACNKYYVWRLVDNFFENAKWEDGWSDEGDYIVNVHGKMEYQGRPAKALLQFTIDPKRGKFDMSGFAINGKPQSKDMRTAIIQKMCEEARQ